MTSKFLTVHQEIRWDFSHALAPFRTFLENRNNLERSSNASYVSGTAEAEHRCDCGQLFSSAALLSRHTTLAHTPPRIRRRRSPAPPPPAPPPSAAPARPDKCRTNSPKTRPSTGSRKSSVRSDTSNPNPKTGQPSTRRKSSIPRAELRTPNDSRRSPKASDRSAPTDVKLRRYAAHRGVPVPEKMRKLMEKSKK